MILKLVWDSKCLSPTNYGDDTDQYIISKGNGINVGDKNLDNVYLKTDPVIPPKPTNKRSFIFFLQQIQVMLN